MLARPCLVRKSGRATSSAAVSSSPCGTGTGGDRGGGVLGLLRLWAGGVTGWCGDLSRPGGCRVGLCRHGFLWGWSDCVGSTRFRCVGTGVHTLWCPLWQQWRTPLCLRVHLGQGGKRCSGHSCSWGLQATCSSAWWPSLQHSSAVLRSRLHVLYFEGKMQKSKAKLLIIQIMKR